MKDPGIYYERSRKITNTLDNSQDINQPPSTENLQGQSDLEDEYQFFRSLTERNILTLTSIKVVSKPCVKSSSSSDSLVKISELLLQTPARSEQQAKHVDLRSNVVPGMSPWEVANYYRLAGEPPKRSQPVMVVRRSANRFLRDGLSLAQFACHQFGGHLLHRQYYYARLSAGSDNPNRTGANNVCRVPTRINGRPATVATHRGVAIWDNQQRLPPLRAAYRNQNPAVSERQHQQRRSSRIPVATRRPSSEPRRLDNPVQMYVGSRIPVNQAGPAPTRVDRPRPPTANEHVQPRQQQPNVQERQQQPNVQERQQQPHVQPPSNGPPRNQHGSYDNISNLNVGQQCPRHNTINVNAASLCQRHSIYNTPDQNAGRPSGAPRRSSCDVQSNQNNHGGPCSAPRRASCDAPSNQVNPGGPFGAPRRASFDVPSTQVQPGGSCSAPRQASCNVLSNQMNPFGTRGTPHRASCNLPSNQVNSGGPCSAPRRASRDVPINQVNSGGPCGSPRRVSGNGQVDQQNHGSPCVRRGLFNMQANQPNAQNLRRDTYDVPVPTMRQRNLNSTGAGVRVNPGGSTFTVSGTINVNTSGSSGGNIFFPEYEPVQQPQHMAIPDLSDVTTEDFLENFERFENVLAPRAIAVPNSPYVNIDPNLSPGNPPEDWNDENMSSIGSEPRSMDISPVYFDGGEYHDMDDDSFSITNDALPFGLEDSFEMPQGLPGSTPVRHSRGASLDNDRGPCGRRRDTFNRHTH